MDPGDHYRPIAGDYDSGVYRVVGVTDGATLLRVADADGRRVHTGELREVESEALEASFVPAEDPDAGISPVAAVGNQLQGLYWSVRRFLP